MSSTNSRQASFLAVQLRVLILEHTQKPLVDTQWQWKSVVMIMGSRPKGFGNSQVPPGYDLWLCC